MGVSLNDNIVVQAAKPLDDRYLKNGVPYTNTADVLAAITLTRRHRGLLVNIAGTEYWFKDGIADVNLIAKSLPATVDIVGAQPSAGATPSSKLLMYNPTTAQNEALDISQLGIPATDTAAFEWDNAEAYVTTEVTTRGGAWYQALSNNTGVEPGTNPAVWQELNKGKSGLIRWTANSVHIDAQVYVTGNLEGFEFLFRLKNATRPFVSGASLSAEYRNGDWELIGEGQWWAFQQTAHGIPVGSAITKKAGEYAIAEPGDVIIGIARIVSANNCMFVLIGQRVQNFSGLTTEIIYYVQADGTYDDTKTDNPLFFSVSANEAILLNPNVVLHIVPASSTGTVVKFDRNRFYGEGAAETGNITLDGTGLQKEVVVTMLHNHSVEPTFGGEFIIINGEYEPDVDNIIMMMAYSATKIFVTISQEV